MKNLIKTRKFYALMRKFVLFLAFLMLLTACNSNDFVLIDNGNKKIRVNIEIADTNEERIMGLMFRESLDEDSGMLFDFQDENVRSFWMKNTLIPLDMIFISENKEIIDIKYAVPCKEDPCPNYVSKEAAKYVLEVNGNFTIKNNIEIGDKIII